jgi:hypothetical protein
MPAHIIRRVRAIRVARLEDFDARYAPPAELTEITDEDAHTAAYLAWLRETRQRVADGQPVPTERHEITAAPEEVMAAIEETARKLTHQEPA